jgi:hypothetical protein
MSDSNSEQSGPSSAAANNQNDGNNDAGPVYSHAELARRAHIEDLLESSDRLLLLAVQRDEVRLPTPPGLTDRMSPRKSKKNK